jgi:hypothetical protein
VTAVTNSCDRVNVTGTKGRSPLPLILPEATEGGTLGTLVPHAMCVDCADRRPPIRRLTQADDAPDTCCECGSPMRYGVYVAITSRCTEWGRFHGYVGPTEAEAINCD